MENHSNPNPIKEYYIAYFDILGYRQFFKEHPDKIENLLTEIHNAISKTKTTLTVPNNVDFFDLIGIDVEFNVKIFSDNIIICLERGENDFLNCVQDNYTERLRAIMFLSLISTIQRGFILDHELFVRGGATIGKLSFNDDYVFGDGLVEVVDIEEHTVYPRIEISKSFFSFIRNAISYTKEEFDRAVEIEKGIKNSVEVSQDDRQHFEKISNLYQPEYFIHMILDNLSYIYYDNKASVSYLYKMNIGDYFSSDCIMTVHDSLKSFSPNTYNEFNTLPNMSFNLSEILKKHKECVVEKINVYGNYNDIEPNSPNDAIQRERVLKKYVWAMAYHNDMFNKFCGNEYYIHSIANCDPRFMTLMINVVDPTQNIFYRVLNEQQEVKNDEREQQKS